MRKYLKNSVVAAAFVAVAGFVAPAMASPTFVGSWRVDQGVYWQTNLAAYSGQSAAVLLFGATTGDYNPGDYLISTVSSDWADINNQAWYSIFGVVGGTAFAQDYLPTANYNDVWHTSASAYVYDNAIGATYTNYAFFIGQQGQNVPEPAMLSIFGLGLLGLGAVRRRKRS